MNLKKYITGPLAVNTYLITDENSKEAILIDVGGNFSEIKRDIDSLGYKLKYILNTHGHFDHILGEVEVQKNYPDIPILMNNGDLSHFSKLEEELKMWGVNIKTEPLKLNKFIDENTELTIGEEKIKILYTPGHSLGSLSYYIGSKVFTGDALFQRSIGRTDFYDGDYDTLVNSIKSKLLILPDNTQVFPGHGPSTTIGEEKKYNTYLK